MVSKIKEGDCAFISFTGKNTADGKVFTTTDEEIAKKNDLYDKNHKYGPVFVIIGKGSLMPALERELVGKKVGEDLNIKVPAAEGFGRRDPKKIETISVKRLRDAGIKPVRGSIVRTKEKVGIITNVSSGRATVDFNHELAGKDLIFDVKVDKLIEERDEKIKGLIDFHFTAVKTEDNQFGLDEKSGTLSVEFPLVHLFNQQNAMKSFQFFNDLTYLLKDSMKKLELKYTFDVEGFNKIFREESFDDRDKIYFVITFV
ncbi:MAG: peptidylprolyl isomerase, partial [Candidatus Thorarchaeota archaeon]